MIRLAPQRRAFTSAFRKDERASRHVSSDKDHIIAFVSTTEPLFVTGVLSAPMSTARGERAHVNDNTEAQPEAIGLILGSSRRPLQCRIVVHLVVDECYVVKAGIWDGMSWGPS
jgi:hypothetical protein